MPAPKVSIEYIKSEAYFLNLMGEVIFDKGLYYSYFYFNGDVVMFQSSLN